MEIRRVELPASRGGVAAEPGAFAQVLERLRDSAIAPHVSRWTQMEHALSRAERRLGAEGRATIELQLMVQRLGAEAQLAAAAGEACSGLFKRINQLAGGG